MLLAALASVALLQVPKAEPLLGAYAEMVVGLRPHPDRTLSLYARRSTITAYFPESYRQAANDPWIRVGETRTKVTETKLEGDDCLLLECVGVREILGNNPLEGQPDVKVKRRIVRTRRIWVADDGSILKSTFEQSEPDVFSIEMRFGNGIVNVFKKIGEKNESGQIDTPMGVTEFENEFLSLVANGKVLKADKTFSTLDPFGDTVRSFQARVAGRFDGSMGGQKQKGIRVEFKEGKATSVAWVNDKNELVQFDSATGEKLSLDN